MAATERFTLISNTQDSSQEVNETSVRPGLRISIRTTTSSLSDYPEWNLDELRFDRKDAIVTDGACS